jgi:hypothetical protein
MSNKHKSRKRDNTIRIAVGIFAAFIVIVGTVLLINNRSLSYIATVNGQRIPIEQFHYQWDMTENAAWEAGWRMFLSDMDIAEWALDSLVELHVVAARADEVGAALSAENIEQARQEADSLREWFTFQGQDGIARMGFSRASFNSFIEMQILAGLVAEEVAGRLEISEEELAAAFEEYISINSQNYIEPLVHFVEHEDLETTQNFREGVEISVADIRGFIRTEVEIQSLEDIEPVPFSQLVHFLGLSQDIFEHALTMHPGELSELMPLPGGGFGFFLVDRFEFVFPEAEIWKAGHESELRFEHYRAYLEFWLDQAEITRNERHFRNFAEAGGLDFDFGPEIELGDINE